MRGTIVRLGRRITLGVFFLLGCSVSEPRVEAGRRIVEFAESMSFDPAGKKLRVWIPVPRTTLAQKVELLSVETPVPYKETQDKDFGNKILYLETDGSKPVTVKTRYRITRIERRDLIAPMEAGKKLSKKEEQLYTSPRGLVVINDAVRAIANASVKSEQDDLKEGRMLYETVLGRMAYDKNTPGWGRGDTIRACEVGKGNCTDFHSLFMSLARTRAIPARFHMGIPFSKEMQQSLDRKYHCWAEFYVSDKGWIAVDISEAWKNRDKRDYFFGNLDEDRLTMTVGREIYLDPPQDGKALNYFAYPYVEVGGKPHPLYDLKREVRTVKEKA